MPFALPAPPFPLPRPGRWVPFALQKALLERTLNRVFHEPLSSGALDFLRGRWLRITVEDAGLEWLITRGTRGLLVLDGGVDADVSFRGKLREFLLLASRRVDPDTLFFQRRLTVTGNTELGLACKNVMDAVEFERWPPLLRQLLHAAEDLLGSGRLR